MCIAIWKPEEKIISKETLARCFKANPDGAGYMYSADGKLHMKKGFFNFDDFYNEYVKDEEHQCLIHFRIKTHGEISVENCHPFIITNNIGFIHNGIISGYGSATQSDTLLFNEEILKPIVTTYGKKSLWSAHFKKLIEAAIGYSKLVFLTSSGESIIYNEQKGEWDEGVWYSNTSYKEPKVSASVKHYPELDTDYSYYKRSYDRNQYVPNTKLVTTKPEQDTYDATTYYLKKSNGYHIYTGDWVELNRAYNELEKGDWVEVIHIAGNGMCKIRTIDDAEIENIPGAFLTAEGYALYSPYTQYSRSL